MSSASPAWPGQAAGRSIMPDRGTRRKMAVAVMGAVLIWFVRLLLAAAMTGTLALLAALILLVRDGEADLRRALGGVAMWCFSGLALWGSAVVAFVAIRHMSRIARNAASRRRLAVRSRSGENRDSGS